MKKTKQPSRVVNFLNLSWPDFSSEITRCTDGKFLKQVLQAEREGQKRSARIYRLEQGIRKLGGREALNEVSRG